MSPGFHGQAVVKAEKMVLKENSVTLLMLLVRLSLKWNIDFFRCFPFYFQASYYAATK